MNCHDLVNQSYCINNKKYSKEEYQKITSEKRQETAEKYMPSFFENLQIKNSEHVF
jgi:hypothetical protein